MKTSNVSNVVISKIKSDLVEQLTEIGKDNFHGASVQLVEEKFIETLGKAGSVGLSELFSQNDDTRKIILHDGLKHYLKFKSTGKYLTLLGEISVERGIYQSNFSNKSFCPLDSSMII